MAQSDDSQASTPRNRRKILIGVFDPAFPDLTLDQLVEKYQQMGVEAAEIGTGGYPNNKHCPLDDLLADPAKLRAWKKKFDDHNIQVATLSCHGNPVHPDKSIAERDDQTFRKTVLLEGLDDIGMTLKHEPEITAYEQRNHPKATLYEAVDSKQ